MSAPSFKMPSRPLTWLITGCSSGLGLSLTRYALSHGQRVIATSRQPSCTPELVTEVQNKGGEWHVFDVDDLSAAHDLVGSLEASGKHIDVLVNNAGSILFGAVEQLADEELRGQMETLYFGPSRLIRAVVPRMRERRFGVVVNISSGAALDGRDSMGGYAAAKAALDGMSLLIPWSWVEEENVCSFSYCSFVPRAGKGGCPLQCPSADCVAGNSQHEHRRWIHACPECPAR